MRRPLDHHFWVIPVSAKPNKWIRTVNYSCDGRFLQQGHHALVFSHGGLMYAFKMERYIVVVDYECGRGKIDNSSNTLSEATISS